MKKKEKITSGLSRFGRWLLVECAKVAIKYYIAEILKNLF